jgi:hypothetical protein
MSHHDFDEYEMAVLNAVRRLHVDSREWFRKDQPEYGNAFDRLAAKKYILPATTYHLAPDVLESMQRRDGEEIR